MTKHERFAHNSRMASALNHFRLIALMTRETALPEAKFEIENTDGTGIELLAKTFFHTELIALAEQLGLACWITSIKAEGLIRVRVYYTEL